MAYIVVFDDGMGLCCPFGEDSDCEGAICASSTPVIFECRSDARAAIKISTKYAELCEAQGECSNGDFLLPARKHVKILRCTNYTASQAER